MKPSNWRRSGVGGYGRSDGPRLEFRRHGRSDKFRAWYVVWRGPDIGPKVLGKFDPPPFKWADSELAKVL